MNPVDRLGVQATISRAASAIAVSSVPVNLAMNPSICCGFAFVGATPLMIWSFIFALTESARSRRRASSSAAHGSGSFMGIFVSAGQPLGFEIRKLERRRHGRPRSVPFLHLRGQYPGREQAAIPTSARTGTESMRTPRVSMTPGPNNRCKIGRCIKLNRHSLPVVVKARVSSATSAGLAMRISSICQGTPTPPPLPVTGTSSAAFNSAGADRISPPATAAPR